MFQLLILITVIERKYRNTIVDIEGKAEAAIVNDEDIFQIMILEDMQILDVAERCWNAVLSVESRLEDLFPRIQKVKNCISVSLLTGGESYNLKLLPQLLEAFYQMWSDI